MRHGFNEMLLFIFVKHSRVSNIFPSKQYMILVPLGFLAATKQFPCLLYASATQKGCSNLQGRKCVNSAHILLRNKQKQPFFSAVVKQLDRANALLFLPFCKSPPNPCHKVLGDTHIQTCYLNLFCNRPSFPCAKSSTLSMASLFLCGLRFRMRDQSASLRDSPSSYHSRFLLGKVRGRAVSGFHDHI